MFWAPCFLNPILNEIHCNVCGPSVDTSIALQLHNLIWLMTVYHTYCHIKFHNYKWGAKVIGGLSLSLNGWKLMSQSIFYFVRKVDDLCCWIVGEGSMIWIPFHIIHVIIVFNFWYILNQHVLITKLQVKAIMWYSFMRNFITFWTIKYLQKFAKWLKALIVLMQYFNQYQEVSLTAFFLSNLATLNM